MSLGEDANTMQSLSTLLSDIVETIANVVGEEIGIHPEIRLPWVVRAEPCPNTHVIIRVAARVKRKSALERLGAFRAFVIRVVQGVIEPDGAGSKTKQGGQGLSAFWERFGSPYTGVIILPCSTGSSTGH